MNVFGMIKKEATRDAEVDVTRRRRSHHGSVRGMKDDVRKRIVTDATSGSIDTKRGESRRAVEELAEREKTVQRAKHRSTAEDECLWRKYTDKVEEVFERDREERSGAARREEEEATKRLNEMVKLAERMSTIIAAGEALVKEQRACLEEQEKHAINARAENAKLVREWKQAVEHGLARILAGHEERAKAVLKVDEQSEVLRKVISTTGEKDGDQTRRESLSKGDGDGDAKGIAGELQSKADEEEGVAKAVTPEVKKIAPRVNVFNKKKAFGAAA